MSRPRWYYTLRNLPLRACVAALIGLVRVLPERGGYALGRGLALTVWCLFPRWRRTSARNLELFFGDELSRAQRARIGREAAAHLGCHVIEFIRMGFLPVERALAMVVEAQGLEHYEQALSQGRGAIGLAMHYGNWELSGAYLSMSGKPLYAVGKEQRDEYFTRVAFPWRARYGIKNIYAGDKLNSAIFRALHGNAVLGLLADQNGGKSGTFAPFAGTLASTVAGPAALALKTGAPLLLTICRRVAPGKHKFIVTPPLATNDLPADKQQAIVELLTRINRAYEEVIREDPTQWLWGHKRWKTRPPGEPWLY